MPNNVRIRDVANAIGILAGLKPVETPINGGFFFDVPGVEVKACGDFLADCAHINLKAPAGEKLIDGSAAHSTMYHFEFDVPAPDPDIHEQSRGMIPPSTPFWCAVGLRLVKLFGGSFCATDTGYHEETQWSSAAHWLNGASNGAAWGQQQRRIFELGPVTKAEIEAARGMAAYK
jgi:hypothetical protein